MKRYIKYFSFVLVLFCLFIFKVNATNKSVYVNLDNLEYSTDKKIIQV